MPGPADLVVGVGAADRWSYGRTAAVVSLSRSGPVRLVYAMTEPKGPTWVRHLDVRAGRRRRVLAAVLSCGVLEGAGAGLRSGDLEETATPYGWLHVAGGGRSAWVPLPADRRVGGVVVLDLVMGLVPRGVWRDLHRRRQAAWDAWARRQPLGDGGVRAVGDTTVPDGTATRIDPAVPHYPAGGEPGDRRLVGRPGYRPEPGGRWPGGWRDGGGR